jgi:ATP-dependent Clp protease ATP-binding subunit ClpA
LRGLPLFSRFSPASKRVLRAAEQECRNLNHYYVGVEHVLLALLELHDPAIEARLDELGIEASEMQADLRRRVGAADDRLWDGILVTPRVRAVVRLAEAAGGDGPVEPVHLLEAIRTEGRSTAAEIVAAAARNPAGSRPVTS